jgi:hypothetical protein
MLKRTKSGNKAVLDEAKNSLNTAVTAAGKIHTFSFPLLTLCQQHFFLVQRT